MDPRQQSQGYSGATTQKAGGNYGFNSIQNDSFSSFVNDQDNDSAFESSWNNPAIPPQQQHVNGFEQGNHAWQPNAYQSSSLLGPPQYGVPSRDYDQPYSRSPSTFNYPTLDPNQSQTFSSNSYDNTNLYENPLYGHGPLNNAQFEYSGPAGLQEHQHNTISPQALQTYPSFLPQSLADESQQSHYAHYNSTLPVRRPSATGSSSHAGPNWVGLAGATSASISPNGLHIKPTAGLQNATKSRREDGFVFVGIGNAGPAGVKIKIARNDRKRSLKAIRRIIEIEKGSDALPKDRGHLMKKLKLTESKLGSRPTKASTNSRSGSLSDSVSSSESSDSESDDESASEFDVETIEPEELNPLPATRPADPNKAVEYDVIKAVWAKKKVGLSGTVIRFALGEYWDIFKGIRDKWKTKAASLQQAVEKKDHANIKAYERRVLDQRRLLESCIGLTLKHGHPDIIEKLGENPAFLAIFYQFLADRIKESEYTGGLIASILELLTRCVTIDQSILEKTKLDKVLPRIVKRGDDRGKVFAQKVLDKAANVSKQKTTAKAGEGQQPNGVASKPLGDHKDIKREQSDDGKKGLGVSSKGSGLIAPAKSANPPAKVDAKVSAKITAADSAAAKTKANNVITKPTGFFAGLKSASKKPGTSAKTEDGKASSISEPRAEVAPVPPKSGFSFAATMAALSAQKEATPVKTEEIRKPETAEEKKKRLRKEERRKLRVSFKADDDLVQVREFVHDPEEELGHEDSQVRDVKDTRGEGQMLKMHRDLDIDDEEDYEPPEEIILPGWTAPQPVDFSVVDEQESARNYTSRGGKAEVKSPEHAAQEQREQATLMAIYTSDSDIPFSAREPSDTFAGDSLMEESFGPPDDLTRAREAEYYIRRNAQPVTANPPVPDISALLRIIQTQNQGQTQQAPQPVATSAPSAGLESIFAQFANSTPQQASQIQQQPAHQQAHPYDFQAAVASMQTAQPQPGYGAAPLGQTPNLQALLAGLTNPAASQVPQVQGYEYGAQYPNENDRKRQYDQDDSEIGRKRAKGGPGSSNYKTKVCRYFKDGKCRRGDDCSYLHE